MFVAEDADEEGSDQVAPLASGRASRSKRRAQQSAESTQTPAKSTATTAQGRQLNACSTNPKPIAGTSQTAAAQAQKLSAVASDPTNPAPIQNTHATPVDEDKVCCKCCHIDSSCFVADVEFLLVVCLLLAATICSPCFCRFDEPRGC